METNNGKIQNCLRWRVLRRGSTLDSTMASTVSSEASGSGITGLDAAQNFV